jgi:hypothetical protein
MNETIPDTKAIEDQLSKDIANAKIAESMRPKIVPVPTDDRNKQAMNAVNRKSEREALQIEAFIDEALHARIVLMRGSYKPGPRDSYVRKMVLDAINSIGHTNGQSLDS